MDDFDDGGMDAYAVDGDDYGVEDDFAINYGYGEEDFVPPTSNLPRADGRKNKNLDGDTASTPTASNNNGSHKVQDLVKGLKTASSSNVENAMDQKPRILLMGLRRSGKSSIQKVVFQKMSPHETLFLESTNKIIKNDISNNSFVQFQIWDFPGQIDFFDSTFESELIFGGCGALLFVIDAQDDYMEAVQKLNQTIAQATKVNPNINFEVFVHKVDGLSEDHKIDVQREIQQLVNDSLQDSGQLGRVPVRYYLTSIYDHSIFEAFSKVIQKLIPQLPTLEKLLDLLVDTSSLDKAFLYDVVSKIYIATDSSPVDSTTYELCSDMIDVVIDISCIYGAKEEDSSAYDEETSSVIKLNNQKILFLREVNRYLALVCIISKDKYEKIGLINYNLNKFKQAIYEVFEVKNLINQKKK